MDDLGKRIAAARGYAGFSQAKLASELGTSQSTVQRIESASRGLKPFERTTLLPAIAKACGLQEAWFYADLTRLGEIVPPDASASLIGPGHGLPRIPGATGRHLEEDQPSDEGLPAPGLAPGTGNHEGELG